MDQIALVLADYTAGRPTELTCQKNELVVIAEVRPSGWWAVSRVTTPDDSAPPPTKSDTDPLTTSSGLFPSNFLLLPLSLCRVCHGYEPRPEKRASHLALAPPSSTSPTDEQLVLVFAEQESGWWKGARVRQREGRLVVESRVGLFPSTFVEVVQRKGGSQSEDEAALAAALAAAERANDAPAKQSTSFASSSSASPPPARARPAPLRPKFLRHSASAVSLSVAASRDRPSKGKDRERDRERDRDRDRGRGREDHAGAEGGSGVGGPVDGDVPRVVALSDYTAKRPGELSFTANDILTVVRRKPTGWWVGELRGERGRFNRALTAPLYPKGDGGERASDGDRTSTDGGERDADARAADPLFSHIRSHSVSSSPTGSSTPTVGRLAVPRVSRSDKERDRERERERGSPLSPRMRASKAGGSSNSSNSSGGGGGSSSRARRLARGPSVEALHDRALSPLTHASTSSSGSPSLSSSSSVSITPSFGTRSALVTSSVALAETAEEAIDASGAAAAAKGRPAAGRRLVVGEEVQLLSPPPLPTSGAVQVKRVQGDSGWVAVTVLEEVIALPLAMVRRAFRAKKAGQISLELGQFLRVLRRPSDREWWTGVVDEGVVGAFPRSCVRVLTDEEAERAAAGGEETLRRTYSSTRHSSPASRSGTSTPRSSSPLASGGTASGRHHSLRKRTLGTAPVLYAVKGREVVTVLRLPTAASSLNDGDVFVLDASGTDSHLVVVWNGTTARPAERAVGLLLGSYCVDEGETHIEPALVVAEAGSEPAELWQLLGGRGAVASAVEGGDDAAVAAALCAGRKVWRAAGPSRELEEVTDANDVASLSRYVLSPTSTMVLVTATGKDVFVWIGRRASKTSRREALALGGQLVDAASSSSKAAPSTAAGSGAGSVVRAAPPVAALWTETDGHETGYFRAQFDDWDFVDEGEHDRVRTEHGEAITAAARRAAAVPELREAAASLEAKAEAAARADPARLFARRFNSSPSKALAYAAEAGLLPAPTDPVALASILHDLRTRKLLNLAVLGDFLSGKDELAVDTLVAFAAQIKLDNLDFVAGLREFLAHFRLPGEAQKIDRVMETFASSYHRANPASASLATDTLYILAFSAIMLNTDLHNPAIKKKMTKEEYVARNRTLGEGLTDALLEQLFDEIATHEIKLDVDAFGGEEHSGWLQVPKGLGRFGRRWCVISNNTLYWFAGEKERRPQFMLPLEAVTAGPATGVTFAGRFAFEISPAEAGTDLKACRLNKDGVLVASKVRTLTLGASSDDERDAWLASLAANVLENPFYQFVQQRLGERRRGGTELDVEERLKPRS